MSEAQRPAPPPPPPVTDVKFSDDIKEVVAGSYAAGAPALVAYVDENGQPSLSTRGSTQVYSDTQLAIWIRAGSNLANALAKNNRVSVLIRVPETRATLNFRGRATLESDEAVRQKVWSSAPENEQKADPEMKGQPLILDVDRLDGRTPAGPVRQLRGGGS
jgi:general stress protein 26